MTYKTFRKEQRDAARYFAVTCLLSILSDEDLSLLELPMTVKSDILDARSEDDNNGVGLAFLLSTLSNQALTPTDSMVCGQIAMVAGGIIIDGGVVNKRSLDLLNVLKNRSLVRDFVDFVTITSEKVKIMGRAWPEEISNLVEYIEQYDKNVRDTSVNIINSKEEGESETPDSRPWWEQFLDNANPMN